MTVLGFARESAASLAQAFRGSLVPVRRINPRQPVARRQQRILVLYADWSPNRVQPLIEGALVVHAAMAPSSTPADPIIFVDAADYGSHHPLPLTLFAIYLTVLSLPRQGSTNMPSAEGCAGARVGELRSNRLRRRVTRP